MNLVTGATGTIGAHLTLKLLQQNQKVICIKRAGSDVNKTKKIFSYYTSDYEKLFERIIWVDADVTDMFSILDALEGVDVVYHCAGIVTFNKKQSKELFKINIEGTANMVNACLEKNIKAFCHVSSIAAIYNPDIKINIHENVYWKSSPNVGNYAISKYGGEREVWRGIEEGLNAVIVNPGIVLAPGFWNQSSGKLFSTCFKGMLFYGSGSSATVDVEDVVNCMIALVEKKQFNQRFILTENNYSYKEILSKIHVEFGNKPPGFLAPKFLLIFANIAESILCFFTNKEPLLTKETAISSLDVNTYSNAKIKQAIGYEFKPINKSLKFICNCFLIDFKRLS